MRKSVFFTAFLFQLFILQGQTMDYNIAVGDVLVLGAPNGSTYTAVDFPRRNTIIKRGAIADFNALIGKRVFVEQLLTDEEGQTKVTLKRADGLNFFRFLPNVEANVSKAIALGELKTIR